MNPFTKSITSQLHQPELQAFVEHWDALEALVIGVFQAKAITAADDRDYTNVRNWLQQRARWMKGFLQSWLVHMRNPILLLRQVGFTGFLVVQAMLIGVVLSATFYPVFIVLTALFIWNTNLNLAEPNLIRVMLQGSYLGFFIIGSGIMMLSGALALRRKGYFGWWGTLATMPIYWMLASIAAWMALWQFIHAPFLWNKTRHGLSRFQTR